jgi:hypothetical protein
MSRFRSNRFFALQVASHDTTFAPRSRRTSLERALFYCAFVPALVLLVTPSFKIGLLIQTAPGFSIPDKVTLGSVFTLPADTGLRSIQIAGRPLIKIDKPRPLFLGTADDIRGMALDVTYEGPKRRLDPASLLPRFEHPRAHVYSKIIQVEPRSTKNVLSESVVPANSAPAVTTASSPTEKTATEERTLERLFEQSQGQAQAACWKQPELQIVDSPLSRRTRRGNPGRLATLSAAAAGEVVHAGKNGTADRTVVISHGGGLFSRYDDLKDLQVRQGEKIRKGQILGLVNAGTIGSPASINWSIRFGLSEVNPENFLALSSQLCDSK